MSQPTKDNPQNIGFDKEDLSAYGKALPLDWLDAYESLDIAIYIGHLQTFEVLYQNTASISLIGDVVGKKCYEGIRGFNAQCSDCVRAETLKCDCSITTTNRYVPDLDKYFTVSERLIRWIDGGLVRLGILIDVTAENKLMLQNKEKEAINRWQLSILENAQDYISIIDLDKNVIYNSPGAYKMSGLEIPQNLAEGLPVGSVHSEAYRNLVISTGIPTAHQKGSWTSRGDLIRPDGKRIAIEQSIFPIYDDHRKLTGTGTIMRDISKTIENEELLENQLRQQKFLSEFTMNFATVSSFDESINKALHLLSHFLNQDEMRIYIDDAKNKTLKCQYEYHTAPEYENPVKIIDYAPIMEVYEAVQQTDYVLFHEGLSMPENIQAVANGCKSLFIVPMRTNNKFMGFLTCGSYMEKIFIDDQDQNIAKMAATIISSAFARDANEKAVEREYHTQLHLKEISTLLSSDHNLAENIQTAIGMVGTFLNLDRILIYKIFNDIPRYADRSHAWKCEDLVAPELKFTQLSSEVVDDFYKWFGNDGKYAMKDVTDFDDALCRKMASANIKSAMGIPLYQEHTINGVLCLQTLRVYRDWTEYEMNFAATAAGMISTAISRETMQRDIISERDRANEASRAKSNFLSNMSHEIRTPMNAILGMTKIGKASNDIDKMRYSLEKIDEASVHLLGLINDVLDMSKIEANKLDLEEHAFVFDAMLSRIFSFISIKAEEKKQKLTLTADPFIPNDCIGDELRLSQVITNLLSNAVKFTPEGGSVELRVKLATDSEDSDFMVHFEIIDSGIGISNDSVNKLFAPFSQADSGIARKFGGTGLGLVICKSIVELMHGTIGVESEPQKGSCFYFSVRLKKNLKVQHNAAPVAEFDANEAATKTFSKCTVLIVEDIEINREIAIALLEDTKVMTVCAENGEIAVKMFAENPDQFDVILMDMQMPVMDGLEACRQIRALDMEKAKSIPIVAMTANAFKEDIENCKKAGMNGHLGKPINVDELIGSVTKYLVGKED